MPGYFYAATVISVLFPQKCGKVVASDVISYFLVLQWVEVGCKLGISG